MDGVVGERPPAFLWQDQLFGPSQFFMVGIRAGDCISFPSLERISTTKISASHVGTQSLGAASSQVSQFFFQWTIHGDVGIGSVIVSPSPSWAVGGPGGHP